ncbi:MAG TPA: UDP-N-acetylmuramoyl-L-alanine--D-glutamate ligase [Bacilli bacterium]|nr:UDP-N-acetylmuramoyl-L-alanine--D-glutamate ligase [Bacilli bacterium]
MIDKIINEINKKNNILILGFAREGISTYNLIRKYLKDKHLTIADLNTELLNINPFLKEDKNVNIILGDKYLDNLDTYDYIIKSPGINLKQIDVTNIKSKITSQTGLFLKYKNVKVIGITGTKGKSTTTSLIYEILKKCNKKPVLLGNIGIPIFSEIENIKKNNIVVLELSCHQLQYTDASPNISILLNVYEEHLDLYKSYEEYINAKLNIFKYQNKEDYKIWEIDSRDSYNNLKLDNNTFEITFNKDKIRGYKGVYLDNNKLYLKEGNNNKIIYNTKVKRLIIGEHNLYNIAAAFAVAIILKLNITKVSKIINKFKPLEHRLEYVGRYKKIDFYNDSIATIPRATINCIKSISNIDTVIIGGMNREVNLNELVEFLNNNQCTLNNCIMLPETGHIISKDIKNKNVYIVNDMEEAVETAYKVTSKNKACALSPSAASYNVYKNFEERGRHYKELIDKYSKR